MRNSEPFIQKFTEVFAFLRIAFGKEEFLFQDNFDAAIALPFPNILEHDEKMSSEMDSVLEKIASEKTADNISVISVAK